MSQQLLFGRVHGSSKYICKRAVLWMKGQSNSDATECDRSGAPSAGRGQQGAPAIYTTIPLIRRQQPADCRRFSSSQLSSRGVMFNVVRLVHE